MTGPTLPGAPGTAYRASVRTGILAVLLAVSLFSFMDALIKLLRSDIPTIQILFARVAFGMLPLIPVLNAQGWRQSLQTRRLPLHLVRSAVTLGSIGGFFTAFGLMPLADAYAIVFAAPICITVLAVPILGERVGIRRTLAVLVGFIGVLVVLRPGLGVLGIGGLVMLGATVLYAIQVVMLRLMSRTESNATLVLYFNLIACCATGVALPLAWTPPTAAQWALLVAVGVIGGIAQILITQAYRLAPAAVVSPFMYAQLIWGIIFGVSVFGDVPELWTLIGAAIVMASGLYILHRETVLGRPSSGKPGSV